MSSKYKTKPVVKKSFTAEIDGTVTRVAVLQPTVKQKNDGQLVFNKAFKEAVKAGSFLRADIQKTMREQGTWDDSKQAEYQATVDELLEAERKLSRGKLKLSEAKDLAIRMRVLRYRLNNLSSAQNQLDLTTAEAFAENARFYFYVAECTVLEDTGEKVFSSVEDYALRSDEEVTQKASEQMGKLIYLLDDDYEAKLPENQFLRKYKFCDEKLHLVRKDGKLVNSRGQLVDSEGNMINEDGQLIDKDGLPIDKDGNYLMKTEPFLDEEGFPVGEDGNRLAVAEEKPHEAFTE